MDDGLRARSIDSVKDPEKYGVPPVMELELPAHGELITWSPLLGILDQLMGAPYVFHHLHSDRQAPDVPGKPWHHDYEHSTQNDRSATMIHALHYLDGLSTDTSSLVVLPGSHLGGGGEKRTLRLVAEYADIWHAFHDPATIRHKMSVLHEHCADVGRDPAQIEVATSVSGLAAHEGDPEELGPELYDLGVSLFTVGAGGPDFDLGPLRRWTAWRDRMNT